MIFARKYSLIAADSHFRQLEILLVDLGVRNPANSLALCAELLGTSKAPKRVIHFIFLSFGAISATQPKYGRHSPLAY